MRPSETELEEWRPGGTERDRERIRALVEAVKDAEDETPRPLFRELPPPAEFPLEALGSVLGPAASAIHRRIQAPIALCAQSVLATATLAAQGRADVLLPFGQRRPLSGYFVGVAQSGERKTAVDTLAIEPIHRRELELRERYRHEVVAYRARLEAWQAERKRILADRRLSREERERKLLLLGEEPRKPPYPMLVCNEPTLEGLFRLLRDGPRSVGIFSSESGQLIGGHALSDENRLKTAAGLSAGWDGGPWKRVRSGDGLLVLPNRRVTLNLLAQPHVAAQLLGDPILVDQGLVSRLLVLAPEPASGSRFWREPEPADDAILETYTATVLDVLRMDEPPESEPLPTLAFSREARDLWIAFADWVEARLGADGEFAPIRGFANKAAEHAARIAGVLAIMSDPERRDIAAQDLAAGIELVNFYLGQALRIQAAAATDLRLRRAARLLAWLQEKWGEELVSPVEVYQLGPAEFRQRTQALESIRILEEHGWLKRLEGIHEVRGVRRREVWRLVRGSDG